MGYWYMALLVPHMGCVEVLKVKNKSAPYIDVFV